MALPPYTAYQGVGVPITFVVGPKANPTRFDVHHSLLSKVSPLFTMPNGLPRIILSDIHLPNAEPDTFRTLFKWLYERQPPDYTTDAKLLDLMKLWILAGELGIWRTQNTVLRLGMALMQPKYFICRLDTVRWVYENTPAGSPLRNYITAIFCQRGPPITPSMFSPENEQLGIFRDAVGFLRTLNLVRAGNPTGTGGYNLHALFPIHHTWSPGEGELAPVRVRGCLVTGGEEVEWIKIEYPLPSFLVWGAKWEVLPDMHFVSQDGVRAAAQDLLKQIEFPDRSGAQNI
ncbi:uncharacterized protein J4E79_004746 [Alternaria viburni]|uniref:uncharacterized protein n=1 Tax=Alternaria viburni TaxID=566460 RepID=UPI0020C1F563|nr:uncharacterized protein J4E79_004746 [Alternaria viburni]KAI4662456.1 hypothetical protein J4E79_004746 [Alternaria viburni]